MMQHLGSGTGLQLTHPTRLSLGQQPVRSKGQNSIICSIVQSLRFSCGFTEDKESRNDANYDRSARLGCADRG